MFVGEVPAPASLVHWKQSLTFVPARGTHPWGLTPALLIAVQVGVPPLHPSPVEAAGEPECGLTLFLVPSTHPMLITRESGGEMGHRGPTKII